MLEVTGSGDIIAEVCGTNWTYSPAVLTRVDTDGAPLTPGTSRECTASSVAILLLLFCYR